MAKAPSGTAGDEEPEPSATVADTGKAGATADETAVTGYRGPAPGSSPGAPASAHLSRTGDATATNGATAVSGYVHTLNVQHGAVREPVSWPHQVGVVPEPAQSFQHRAEADQLRAAVKSGGTAVLSQVLTGMGGVGKTQLVADYARAARRDLDVLVWVTASNQLALVNEFARAGRDLCRADPDDAEEAAKQFLAWLAPKPGRRPCRWLVVLDDVADPRDLILRSENPGTPRYSLWPPNSPHGRTLLTTRRRDAALFGEGRRRIDVGLFTPDESVAYLTSSLEARVRIEPASQLNSLARDLGHLPLALAQAAAYLIDSGKTAAAYRDLLADRATKLADLAPDALPDEQATALAAVWSLSIDRADTLRPVGLARPMLHLASLLDANGIPQTVLTGRPALTHLKRHRTATDPVQAQRRKGWLGRWLRPAPSVTPEEAYGALRVLDRLSLIDHTPDTPHQAVRVHQLIQRATRDTHTPHQHDQYVRTAADALMAAWLPGESDTDLAQALRSNTEALTRHGEEALYRPDAHKVLYRLGHSLGGSGQVTAAIAHFDHLTTTACSRLGEDHRATRTARSNLASWRGRAADPAGMAQAFDGALRTVRLLGEDHPHPHTLTDRDNVASWQGQSGDVAGAAAHSFHGGVEQAVRLLGEDHPHTLASRGTVASLRGEAGDAAGAAEEFADLVEHMVRVLGEDHPTTLTARSYLALWLWRAGDATGAAQGFNGLLEHVVLVLGEDHPHTLTVRGNVAKWRGETGDAAGAAQAYADLLERMVRVLGDDHPYTLPVGSNLALWRAQAGDAAGAAQAYADLQERSARMMSKHQLDFKEVAPRRKEAEGT
ncbi:NB-ARC domain-containing protein [Streptomyces sp. HD]|uniref:NB-ARC domain-containing protein n=1 Tax=Streptomyces sp. HD TaxID=3020892 RepID=UPI00232A973F|nr:NB-ARC domain-containing protein [Streptomyces sp. HD]MDC0773889.1 NB-ARC domain-containing protein [Streptomyces sp. HD]